MMAAAFSQDGTTASDREVSNIPVSTPDPWSVQLWSTWPCTTSGPAAFRGFTAFSLCLTWCSWRVGGLELEGWWGAKGVSGLATSKQEKKWLKSSASEISAIVDAVELPL